MDLQISDSEDEYSDAFYSTPPTTTLMADTTLRFGKHSGDTFEEVRFNDTGYCRWVRDLDDCGGQMLEFQEYLSKYRIVPVFGRRRPARVEKPSVSRKAVEGPSYKEVDHDQEADESINEPACIICMMNKRCCVTQPCMHLSYCIGCARRLVFGESGMELKYRGEVECPECRTEVKRIVRVHL